MKPTLMTLCIVCTIPLGGCLMSQKVNYPIDDVVPVASSPFRSASLDVLEFDDLRKPPELVDNIQYGPDYLKVDDETWYYTIDDNYRRDTAVPWVTEMVAKHLEVTGLFAAVGVPGEE